MAGLAKSTEKTKLPPEEILKRFIVVINNNCCFVCLLLCFSSFDCWLCHSTLIVLCSWQSTFYHLEIYKWVLVFKLLGKPDKMLGIICNRIASHPGGK